MIINYNNKKDIIQNNKNITKKNSRTRNTVNLNDNLQKTKEPEYSTVSNTIEENENIVQTKEYVISKEKIKIAAKGIG